MIEPEFNFFQMVKESSFQDSIDFDQSEFRKWPKRFNPIDISVSPSDFMMNSKMLGISN